MGMKERTRPFEGAAAQRSRKEGAREDGMGSVDELTAAELLDGLPSRVHEVYAPFVRDIPNHPAFVEAGRSWKSVV